MKKINLAVGAVFTWFGVEKFSENSNFSGWVLLVVGILTILSAFFSFARSSSRSRWGRPSAAATMPGGLVEMIVVAVVNSQPNKALNSLARLTGMLRSYLAAHPLARRYAAG